MYQQDYFLRLIEQIAELCQTMARLRREGQSERAIDAVGSTWEELFDIPRALVDRTDAASLAMLLDHPERIRAAAELLAAEAQAYAACGDTVRAEHRTELAAALQRRLDVRR